MAFDEARAYPQLGTKVVPVTKKKQRDPADERGRALAKGAHPRALSTDRQRVTCDPLNPCPDRPRRGFRKYLLNPWRCAQCGRWWVTERRTSWSPYEEGGYYVWVLVAEEPEDD